MVRPKPHSTAPMRLYEAGEDDREPAEALEERVGALDVLDAEEAGLLLLEDRRATLVADVIPHLTAEERGEPDEQRHPPDAHPEDAVRRIRLRVRQQAGDDQQSVAGKKEPDQQAGLGEHDEAHHDEGPGAGPSDDGGRIQPGDQGGGNSVHDGGPVVSRRRMRGLACGRWDLNPHARRHRNLNPACLPISPLPRVRSVY
jgi:hypothetical protein